jgi:transposase
MRDLFGRMQAELKFKQTRIEALNFEIARLIRQRFGTSSQSAAQTIRRSVLG